jgi:transposase
MITAQQLEALDPQVRQVMLSLMAEVAARDDQLRSKDAQLEQRDRDAALKQALIDKLTHENALLKRLKFAAQSEKFTAEQRSLLDETFDADLAEVGREMKRLGVDVDAADDKKAGRKTPKRQALPPHLPRRDVHHEPQSTACACGCQMQRIGEDVAEKLDYQPGVFTVERHVRGKWVCRQCDKLVQAAVPAHVIDKGIPTVSLLAQVLVAKFLDHLPLTWSSLGKQDSADVKGSKGLQSYSRPTYAGAVVLLALMAIASKVPICTSGSLAQRQVRNALAPV